MDRGAWQATVHGVAKSWTWLTWLSTHARTRDLLHHASLETGGVRKAKLGMPHTRPCPACRFTSLPPGGLSAWKRQCSWTCVEPVVWLWYEAWDVTCLCCVGNTEAQTRMLVWLQHLLHSVFSFPHYSNYSKCYAGGFTGAYMYPDSSKCCV